MKKYSLLALSLATIVGLVGLSSCSKDDPAPRPQVSFERSTQTFGEGAGVVEVKVILDQVAGENITVDFDIDGTALEGSASTANSDYEITSGSGEVEIKKGQSTGIIEIKIKNDVVFEGDETIDLEITNVSSTGVDITEDNTIAITITEDDLQPLISFTTSEITFNEDDGILDVEIKIDHEATQDITVTYTIDGQDQWQDGDIAVSAEYGEAEEIPSLYWDYTVVDEDNEEIPVGQVIIPQGETTANIRLAIYTDFILDIEQIDLTLTAATGGAGIATAASKKHATITLEQQNGKSIELYWNSVSADLNLFLWGGDEASDFDALDDNSLLLSYSVYAQKAADPANYAFEAAFVPYLISELEPTLDSYGVSVLYRSGTVDPVNFALTYWDYVNGDFEDEEDADIFEGTYNADNKNDWPATSTTYPVSVQTFHLADGAITDYSALDLPETGSRTKAIDYTKARSVMLSSGRRTTYMAAPIAARLKTINATALARSIKASQKK